MNILSYATYHPNLLVLAIVIILILALIPRWPYSADWGYAPIGTILIIILIAWLVLGLAGCTSNGTSPLHGNINTTYTQDTNDPNSGKVQVGGQINFLKRHKTDYQK